MNLLSIVEFDNTVGVTVIIRDLLYFIPKAVIPGKLFLKCFQMDFYNKRR